MAAWALAAFACLPIPAIANDPLSVSASALPVYERSNPDNQFDVLTYLGGLVLNSPDRRFEALSGLAMVDDLLIMVTDEGHWVTARLLSTPNGAPADIADARIGPLLNTDGGPMLNKRLADAEAVTLLGDRVWVTSERNQPIRSYRLENGALIGSAGLPFGNTAPLPGNRNQGLEAMVHMTEGPLAGETLVFLEEPPRRASDPTALRLRSDGSHTPFAVRRMDGFAITGAAELPGGDVVLVERHFSWGDGLYMRLRYLPADEIANGAVQGRLMLHADGGTIIDNMEGIAVSDHTTEPILTIISDDNGNFFQRTILLRFQIKGDLSALLVPTPPSPVARPNL
ncbi:MAG: esterase-like activity of phytase family protein [Cohaesibacteraceae bacterium]